MNDDNTTLLSSSMFYLSEATVAETEMTSPWTVDGVNQSSGITPENCIILGVNTTIPWDNPQNIISLETEFIFDKIKCTIIVPIFFFIGFPANCINMAVFFKQGLKGRINLCLFSLALVDLLCVTLGFLAGIGWFYKQFAVGDFTATTFRYMTEHKVLGLYGIAFCPMFLSVIVSTERCICVLFPMRAQRCIPTKGIAVIIVVGVLTLLFARFAVTAMYQVTCVFEISHAAGLLADFRQRLLLPE